MLKEQTLATRLALLRKRARQFGVRKRMPDEIADDFASFCVEIAMRGRWTYLKYLYVDFKRAELGRGDSEFCRAKRAERTEAGQIFQDRPSKTADLKNSWIPVSPAQPLLNTEKRDLLALMDGMKLDRTERAVLLLYALWGFSQSEIGDLFGVNESRVCQIMRGAAPGHRRR